MMPRPPEIIEESRALTGLTELYRDSMEEPAPTDLERGLDTLLARVSSRRARRRATLRWSLVSAAVAVSTLVALRTTSVLRKSGRMPAPAMLTYRIDGGNVLEGGYLRESGGAGIKLSFSEGSQLAFSPGTRGRIREVDGQGAHFAIERGTASFQVTPSSARRWLVDVGPFLVTVKGTVFTVSWDPLGEHFELTLGRGRVVVTGPVSAGEIALRAGQHLVVNLPRAETVITEVPTEQAVAATNGVPVPRVAAAPELQPTVANDKSAEPGRAVTPARTAKDRGWSDELAHGNWQSVLDDVKRVGVDETLSKASNDDLFALADAARYGRRLDLARAALLAERRRYPESPRTLDALFLLGRVEEARESGVARAIAWYDRYLASAPMGPLAGEALGRKMTLTDKLEGPGRARPVAEDYLRRFPGGSYAGSARELIRIR
jgi:hypothetical protein